MTSLVVIIFLIISINSVSSFHAWWMYYDICKCFIQHIGRYKLEKKYTSNFLSILSQFVLCADLTHIVAEVDCILIG
jgi:hypothetical protein